MKTLEDARVESIREIRPGIWSMWLESPGIAANAFPAQFVHVRINDTFDPLLRRPLSIGRVRGGIIELVWKVIGRGTRLLTGAVAGDSINLLGPLGIPFTMNPKPGTALLVGGGLGLPPLVFLHERFRESGVDSRLILGVADENGIPLADDDPVMDDITIIAENGSRFRRGLATEPVMEMIEEIASEGLLGKTALYSCGPWGLTGALQKLVPRNSLIRSEVSLEQQMGCAMGVCQGCVVKTGDNRNPYQLVCHDGPVFPLFEVEMPNA